MGLCRLKLVVVVCLMGLAPLMQVSQAQNSPQDYINAHNTARSKVGVGPMKWDPTIEAYAQNYANQRAGDCRLVHSGGHYGENIAWSSGDLSGTDSVNMWVGEKKDYVYNSNTCRAGAVCRHYTQVVWSNSVRLGCAKVRCSSGGTFVICSYDPPGNVIGERPYPASHHATQNSSQDYINAHNTARSVVGVGPMTWDPTVAAYAQNYANQRAGDCRLVHSGGRYGENLAWSSGDISGTSSVNLWVAEKKDYDYNSNTCRAGAVCRHYTQVVWSKSVRLGCAKVRCSSGGTFVICSYDPPGNVIGERPYPTSHYATQNSSQDYINAHNAARSEVGVGPMTWDPTVAAYAQNYADQRAGDCRLVHSGGRYGENLAWGSGDLSGTDSVNMWVGEKRDYDDMSNTCREGAVCKHYTQVVWQKSVRLGCARVRCSTGGTFVICSYDPPGNFIGQRPYPASLYPTYPVLFDFFC